MTFAAVTLLGLSMGQPPAPDYYPMNSRTIQIPIEYKKDRKTIRKVLLYVAYKGENTWYQEAFVTPDKDAFVYLAKDDGVYWFKMVIEDLKGNRDPADLTLDPPDLKVVVDTTRPEVRVTNARRSGEEIVLEWTVTDKFLNDAETKVHFWATDNGKGYWRDVTLPNGPRTGVKFPCGTKDATAVKITAVDIAGNKTEVTKEFPAAAAPQPMTALSSPGANGAETPNTNTNTNTGMGTGPITPQPPTDLTPPITPGPIAPMPPITPQPAPPVYTPPVHAPSVHTPPVYTQPSVPLTPYTPPANVGTDSGGGLQPLAVVDPKARPAVPVQPDATPAGGVGGAPANPTVELTRAQVINYPRFDLGFDLEQRGPSGISRVDLWVTRDDGRSWRKWSQHAGKGGAVRVALDVKENQQLEGSYGFRLVPVSGAGLSERAPGAGDAPDMRVVLDLTPPQIDLFLPPPDVNNPPPADTLIIKWQATDRNFGTAPVTLEWSATPTGPWKPIATTGDDPVVQATAVAAPVVRRLPAVGQYGWRVPTGVPARVYIRATARDAAGNVREVVTRDPQLVDLTKPRAKISGIVQPSAVRP